MAALTVLMLGACLVLDQWATTRVDLGGAELAVHFGRTEAVTAGQTSQMGRARRLAGVPYAGMIEAEDTDFGTVDELRTTRFYGTLLFVLTLAAFALRLLGAGLVARAHSLKGTPGLVYGLATVVVGAVFAVAVLFNTGGAVGAYAERIGRAQGVLTGDHGFGLSTWGALFVLFLDAAGILMVKASFARPRRAPAGRRRRRIKG